ncbi:MULTISPECIES: hypothetical protein [Alphaproteobacteria]|uniref:Uncharacterized protein n=2 Tax=Alphaproteobacteria TaxID=28211 RepID=A0A512HGL4_9HYPH|nr:MULTISPECIES: hypothetical protein [Alphaproteobacteria]GEO84588.1 hypothetical protein RNA01_15200 [Ciceribacter naphthalenivorans]GLR22551.1 hypothetical protein GCM10007920_23380 [Ciceribacter naphthalenivorans]GLT05407.1 hypothetical protein GCM10007926_23380 [Sphingomonas psychrolutea]
MFLAMVTVLALAASELHQRGHLESSKAFAIGGSLALANLALGVAGLRTRHRIAWGVYLLASLMTVVLIGSANPVSALVTLTPIWMGAGLEFMSATPSLL